MTSAPPAASACMNSTVRAGSGSPAVIKGIRPLRPCACSAAKVDLIRDIIRCNLGKTLTGDFAVVRVHFVTDKLTSVSGASYRSRAAAHERIEHPAARRATRQHHAFYDFQRLLRRMIDAFGVLP